MIGQIETYLEPDAIPEVIGMTKIEVDDSIVLENSNAATGIRITEGTASTECEVFFPLIDYYYGADGKIFEDGEAIEIVPLKGNIAPFVAPLEKNSTTIDDQSVVNAVKSVLFLRSLS
jgi:hypothetical protein